MNKTLTLREYLEKRKTFVIPNYQRGYVWGKKSKGNELDANVTLLSRQRDLLLPRLMSGKFEINVM